MLIEILQNWPVARRATELAENLVAIAKEHDLPNQVDPPGAATH
jgi:type III secretion system FlhB-like substrate exporter